MRPVLYAGSLVEKGTLTADGALATAPITRLADGDIALPWIDSAIATARHATLDLGPGGAGRAKAWVLAPGHNLAGCTVELESGNSATGPWTVQMSVTVPDAKAVRSLMPVAVVAQCWRLRIVNPVVPARLGEWVLADPLTLPSGPQEPNLVTGPLGNVQLFESPGGYAWVRKRGPSRWEADYMIRDLKHEERAALETAFAATDEGARPLFIDDADGIVRWVYWMTESGKLPFQAEGRTRWRVLLRFREGL